MFSLPERWGGLQIKILCEVKEAKFLPSAMTNLKYAKKWEDLILNF